MLCISWFQPACAPFQQFACRWSSIAIGLCCTIIKTPALFKGHPSNINRPDLAIPLSSSCISWLSPHIELLFSIVWLCNHSCLRHRHWARRAISLCRSIAFMKGRSADVTLKTVAGIEMSSGRCSVDSAFWTSFSTSHIFASGPIIII